MRFILSMIFALSLFAEDITTTHSLELENETIEYKATVGSLPTSFKDEKGKEKGEIAFISYTKETTEPRPITFAFNGGPGSSSIWIHMGTFGPKRIVTPEEGQKVQPPYKIVDNLETLLDVTDLVFIDPIGTGFSKHQSLEDAKEFWQVKEDIESVGDFIRDYLTKNHRWNSPIYLAGESYGTSRVAGLSDLLQSEHGIYLNGLILISCALDFQTFIFENNFLPNLLYFPSYVATSWYHGKYASEKSLTEVVDEAREFAYTSYAPYLFRPRSSGIEKEILFEQLAEMTSLPLDLIHREGGKIEDGLFLLEFFPDKKKTLGRFDSRFIGDYTGPHLIGFTQDPSASSIMGIFSTAFQDYLHRDLNVDENYKLFSSEANHHWKFNNVRSWGGYPNFVEPLRCALVVNPNLKIFVGSGFFDLATPFTATEYCFDQLDLPDSYYENISMNYYEGGHMYYLNPEARKKFKKDLIQFYQEKQ